MPGRAVVVGLAPAIVIALLLASPAPAGAYSVLSHESAIDEAWDHELRPLLLRRFPRSTPADLERAHPVARHNRQRRLPVRPHHDHGRP